MEFHIYEHEVCILVSGLDLWFSRDLSFPKIKTKTTLALHTQTLENADRLIQVRSKNKKKILHLLQIYEQEGVEEIRISLGTCLDAVRHSTSVTFAVKVALRNQCYVSSAVSLVIVYYTYMLTLHLVI